jgi:hypothetical protein
MNCVLYTRHSINISLKQKSSAETLRELFELAEKELHVPQLLDVALVDVSSDWPPDERSILTYLAMYLKLDEVYQMKFV